MDTNVLIYAFATDDARAERAEALLAAGGVVSVQVINEFAAASRRKLQLGWDEIGERLAVVLALLDPPAALTLAEHGKARALAAAHDLNFYDALIIASAIASDARILFTEDMQSGRRFDGVEIQNPFVN